MQICYVDKITGEVIPELNVSIEDFGYINNNTEKATFEEVEKEDGFLAIVNLNNKIYKSKLNNHEYFEGRNFFIKFQ